MEGIPSMYYQEGIDLRGDFVKCITFHSAKGLEFPLVYLLEVDQYRIPGYHRDLNKEERKNRLLNERKLLYVAMTRAMNELIITCKKKGYSRFLNDIDPQFIEYEIEEDEEVEIEYIDYEDEEEIEEDIPIDTSYKICPRTKKLWTVCDCEVCRRRRKRI